MAPHSDRRPPAWRRIAPIMAGLLALVAGAALSTRRPAPADAGPVAPASPNAPGFEPTDMNAADMGWALLLLGVGVGCTVGIVILLLAFFGARDRALQPPLTAEQRAAIVPPQPRLQVDPVRELQDLRAKDDALLHGYAWRDPAHRFARIPIDRAMALAVGQSLDGAAAAAPP